MAISSRMRCADAIPSAQRALRPAYPLDCAARAPLPVSAPRAYCLLGRIWDVVVLGLNDGLADILTELATFHVKRPKTSVQARVGAAVVDVQRRWATARSPTQAISVYKATCGPGRLRRMLSRAAVQQHRASTEVFISPRRPLRLHPRCRRLALTLRPTISAVRIDQVGSRTLPVDDGAGPAGRVATSSCWSARE